MQYFEYKAFIKSLQKLWHKGGRYQKAADQVFSLLGRIRSEDDPFRPFRVTKNGESRVKNAVKYDLNGHCRLITVQADDWCVLAFCGTHEDADQWLDRNRGFVLVVENGKVVETYRTSSEGAPDQVDLPGSKAKGPLFSRLPEKLFDELTDLIPRKVLREIEKLESSSSIADVWVVVAEVPGDLRTALADVLCLLRDDKVKQAITRAELHLGRVDALEAVPTERLPELLNSESMRRIPSDSTIYAEALSRFMKAADYRDWMLYMHPDQEAIVEADFSGPAKLMGVSGSGKTCVVIQRAVRLARHYATEKVLIVTLNRALARMIDELVSSCCEPDVRSRIVVRSLFEQCRILMTEFDPAGARLFDDVTWKTEEHVDEVWQEYYRCELNNDDARVLEPVHDYLLGRGWSAERYLREEVDWLRSALQPLARNRYLDIARRGRTVNLSVDARKAVLDGTSGWEEKMNQIGVSDLLGLAQTLCNYLPKIRTEFRCILVDEVQDFGNVELEILRALTAKQANDLFLCGDAAQAVSTKHQSMKAAGIDVAITNSRRLDLNYRNTREILTSAYEVLRENLTEDMLDREDLEILDPTLSPITGGTTLLLEAQGLAEEIGFARTHAADVILSNPTARVCIAFCGYSLHELTKFGQMLGIPVLDGRRDVSAGNIVLSDLEQTKGFEFDLVVIVNCSGGIVPDAAAPNEERFRDLSRLYVAMTRAKTELILSWSGSPSPFLKLKEEVFIDTTWAELFECDKNLVKGVPAHLASYRVAPKDWRTMSGPEFLYTDMAIGLTPELIGKIRLLVDGQGVRKGRELIRWRNLGTAADSFRHSTASRNLWGPEVGRQFDALVTKLSK
jgi:hypothetical protein